MRDQFTNRNPNQGSSGGIIPKVQIPNIIKLKCGSVINLNEGNGIYQTVNLHQFKENMLNASNFWHMIIVHHFQRASKANILYRLNELAEDNLFAAYCYNEGMNFDFFLVYNQNNFIFELVRNHLKVNIELEEISLELRLKVGTVMPAHPKLNVRSSKIIRERMHNAALPSATDVFDLSSFSSLISEHEIEATLKNKMVMTCVFSQINGVEALKEKFNVFKFARNNISSLEAFDRLYNFSKVQPWRILDLSENNLDSIQVFADLKTFNINELILTGNEVTNIPMYREKIKRILTGSTNLTIDPVIENKVAAPKVEQKKLQEEPQQSFSSGRPQKPKFMNGAGNDAIIHVDEGVLIRRDANKRGQDPQWTHLRDSFQSYRNDTMWTQVIVQHGGLFEPDEIIEEIVTNILFTNPFFPCFYKHMLEHDEFFLFKNFDALNSLMKNDLEYLMPNQKKITFTLRLNAAPFIDGQTNWHPKIQLAITKRLKGGKVLNLDDFINDPLFSNMTIPMNSKYTLSLIFDFAKRQSSAISKISAQNNGISALEFMQNLSTYTNLTTLDLRNNKISSFEETFSKAVAITELLLDGNPICDLFRNPQSYVAEVKKHFASLEWLDECKIDKTLDLVTLQNYFVKRDAYTFAEEFVKTFIPLYDSFERHRLLEMYTDESIFTLSFHYSYTRDFGQDDVYSKIQKYLQYSRNLGLLSDMSKSVDNVIYGKKNIAKVFGGMSKTSHNMASLCVEVVMYDPTKLIILKLSGVFEEQGQSLNESTLHMGYARTFVITPSENHQFVILNDQLFVHKSTAVIKKSLAESIMIKENCFDILPTESEEKKLKLILYEELTELKREVCTKHLDQSFWDIRVALATFNTLMDGGSIDDCNFNFK